MHFSNNNTSQNLTIAESVFNMNFYTFVAN